MEEQQVDSHTHACTNPHSFIQTDKHTQIRKEYMHTLSPHWNLGNSWGRGWPTKYKTKKKTLKKPESVCRKPVGVV